MSGEQLIPKAVGRLDDVVKAFQEGRPLRVYNLLHKEDIRLRSREFRLNEEIEKVSCAITEVDLTLMLASRIAHGDASDREKERWNEICRACGWKGQTE